MQVAQQKPRSEGPCKLCGGSFAKQAMTRHVASCLGKRTPSAKASPHKLAALHLVVDAGRYWLHLLARADATLADLDAFLRDKWLECCGHLSCFTIGGSRFHSDAKLASDERGMDAKLGEALAPGQRFEYEYDFGTTTGLQLRVAGVHAALGKAKVTLLAHNAKPVHPCAGCSGPGTRVCTECWTAVCEACAPRHGRGEHRMLPLVNSPRSGACGYVGPGLV